MKKCKCCGKKLDDSFFYRNKKGYLSSYCNACHRDITAAWRKENKEKVKEIQKRYRDSCRVLAKGQLPEPETDYLGGWNIAILNHTKVGESKYQAVNTNGKSFLTSDKGKFLQFLLETI